MKRYIKRSFFYLVLIAVFVSILFIMPTHIFAQSHAEIDVFPGLAGENTQINVHVVGYMVSSYTVTVLKFNGSAYVQYGTPWNGTYNSGDWSQTFNISLPYGSYRTILTLENVPKDSKDFYVTTCYYEDEVTSEESFWSYSNQCRNNIMQVYIWFDGDERLMSSDGDNAPPNDILAGIDGVSSIHVRLSEGLTEVRKIRYYFNCCYKAEPEAEPIWVRQMPMTCWQVWINEYNDFEFIFWYPYKDNNWVRIYDLEGNMVYEVDMPIDDPHIMVDLPDGMYIVKTFWIDPDNPIQEFIIGKP